MALEGVRVLDSTQMMLGPYGTHVLGDLGADVINVERLNGDWERRPRRQGGLVGGDPGGDAAAFLAMNRNKPSVAADLRCDETRDPRLEIGATCDVVVGCSRPGVLTRRGLGYPDFRVDVVGSLFGAPEVTALDAWSQRDEVKKQILESRAAARPTSEWLDVLLRAGVWCGRVRRAKEAVDELRADGANLIVRAQHAEAREVEPIGYPIRVSGTRWRVRYAPPSVREHTDEVPGDVLSGERIERADGVMA